MNNQELQEIENKQTSDVKETKGMTWEDLQLKENTIKGILQKGWTSPSPVQEEAIPLIKEGHHVIARSKNGTGKTAAFLIPTIDSINPEKKKIQAIILVPTRELAVQTENVIKEVAAYSEIKTMVSTGGNSIKDDIIQLQKTVHIRKWNIN